MGAMKLGRSILLFYLFANCNGASDKHIRPFHDIATTNVSMSLFVTSVDARDGAVSLSYVQNLKWQDPRMMYPDITGHKSLNNRTIITMDLAFLENLWTPDIAVINALTAESIHHQRLRIDSSGFIYLERLQSVSVPSKKMHYSRRTNKNTSEEMTSIQFELFQNEVDEVALEWEKAVSFRKGLEDYIGFELRHVETLEYVSSRGPFSGLEVKLKTK